MKKAFIYKLNFNRPRATSWVKYFTMEPTVVVVMEALAIEHLADLQTLRPSQTEQAGHVRNWYDRMIEEIEACGIPDVGPSLGTTTRKRRDGQGYETEITVEKMEAFV